MELFTVVRLPCEDSNTEYDEICAVIIVTDSLTTAKQTVINNAAEIMDLEIDEEGSVINNAQLDNETLAENLYELDLLTAELENGETHVICYGYEWIIVTRQLNVVHKYDQCVSDDE